MMTLDRPRRLGAPMTPPRKTVLIIMPTGKAAEALKKVFEGADAQVHVVPWFGALHSIRADEIYVRKPSSDDLAALPSSESEALARWFCEDVCNRIWPGAKTYAL